MKERSIAILVCLFGGCFGIHKFYLGKNVEGILYLVFSWTGIPMLLGFFDFFGLCFMSEREFTARFNHPNFNTLDRQRDRPPVSPTQSLKEATATLYDLKKLYEDGIITAEEYESKRRKMLNNI